MIALHDVGTFIALLLGSAFLAVWFNDRQNAASFYWGLAHFALAFAALSGYRYQTNGNELLAVISLFLTSTFLTSMSAANLHLIGHKTPHQYLITTIILLSLAIFAVGWGVSQVSGRMTVLALQALMYLWSGWVFLRIMHEKLVSIAFIIKTLSVLINLSLGDSVYSTNTPLWMSVQNWASSIMLIIVLISFSILYSRNRLKHALIHLSDAVCALQKNGTLLFCNTRFAKLCGATEAGSLEGSNQAWLLNMNPTLGTAIADIQPSSEQNQTSSPIYYEDRFHTPNGEQFDAEILLSSYLELGAKVIVLQIRDITERKEAEADKIRLASTDGLTGLYNRKSFEIRLSYMLWEAKQQGNQCALMILDIANFKAINKIAGAEAGDEVLHRITNIINTKCQEKDLVARLGSDEFVIARIGSAFTNFTSAFEVFARSLLADIDFTLQVDDISLIVSARVGITYEADTKSSASQMIHRAQLALMEAKAAGSSQLITYEETLDSRFANSIRIESALRHAIEHHELSLVYQPIIDSRTGRVVKAEALCRWNSRHMGHVPPSDFIPIAEKSDLIIELGKLVLKAACTQVKAWHESIESPPVVTINISVQQFLDEDFIQHLMDLTQELELQPSWIELEVTETLFAGDSEKIQDTLALLGKQGFHVSLDDFGTGYSSLSYLTRFHLDTVKVDRSFVSGMTAGSKQHAIVRAIISMSHSLGLVVVAEGVETREEYDLLVADGCDFLQGYLFSKPINPEEIPKLLIGRDFDS